jgi:hypothetical protein
MSAPQVIVTDEHRFQIGGARFRYVPLNQDRHRTTRDEIVVLKTFNLLDSYRSLFDRAPTKNVLEIGVFEGGSLIAFALLHPDFRFVGIDQRAPNPCVIEHIERLGLSDRVTIHYGVSQTDEDTILHHVQSAFHDESIGLVSEDASHRYALSKRSFEILFPRLAVGGGYSIEDWSWAHWPGKCQHQATEEPALSNLVFKLAVLTGMGVGAVSHMEIFHAMAVVWRGSSPFKSLDLDRQILARGRSMQLI